VVRFSRHPRKDDPNWRPAGGRPDLTGTRAVVNLAGASIARRWTRRVWEGIVESRVGLTRRIVRGIGAMAEDERPRVLLNASAVGFYPARGDAELREDAAPGAGRLSLLCRDWEAAAVEAESLGVRVVRLRSGVVLGRGGEAWERLRRVFSLGLGGRLGSGMQWMPWIHLDDEVGAIEFALRNERVRGPLNLCAPEPVTNREFTRLLGAHLGRPAVLPVPALVLRTVLDGFAESLLSSRRAVPERLDGAGFEFRYGSLEEALGELCGD